MITKDKCFICYQILPTNSLRKCVEVSLEKLYFDIGVRIEARREETDFGV